MESMTREDAPLTLTDSVRALHVMLDKVYGSLAVHEAEGKDPRTVADAPTIQEVVTDATQGIEAACGRLEVIDRHVLEIRRRLGL